MAHCGERVVEIIMVLSRPSGRKCTIIIPNPQRVIMLPFCLVEYIRAMRHMDDILAQRKVQLVVRFDGFLLALTVAAEQNTGNQEMGVE